ncbi:methyltransferase domain-containing protein [Nocardioides solisilvae]|uniref:methyltransferase domain-containing protein n=1 Tax=Nocardioides solisilvae TaxID=1542435 RepID=UPI000D744221|nr:methyltransferase domain-containing protein [Nocardioides solisilvae]
METREQETRESVVGGLRIAWDGRVLEPRPWTAAQAEWLAELSPQAPEGPALELCSGAGHIGLLLQRLTGRDLVMVDANPVACEFAAANAAAAGLAPEVRNGWMDEVLAPDERFALVCADPPWVPRAEITRYPQDPELAIDGGPDGLDVAALCVALIDRHLADGGHAVLQLGTAEQVDALLAANPPQRLRLDGVRTFERGVLAHLATDGREVS